MLSEEQRLARKNYIGGSDAGVILGYNPYKTIHQLYLEKIGEGVEEDLSKNKAVQHGNKMEPVIRQWFADYMSVIVVEEPNMLFHPDYYWMAANIDGRIVGRNHILEIKTARTNVGWGQGADNETIPKAYLAQVAHYCIVTGADVCHVAVQFGGCYFRNYIYRRNSAIERHIIEQERKFWEEHVLPRVPPTVD